MSDKRILVFGGTGAMGQFLVPILADMGHTVDCVALDTRETSNPRITYYRANLSDNNYAAADEFLSRRYDAVVDFLTYSTARFAARRDKLLSSTDHYIYLSSCRVYANEEVPIVESSPRLLDVSTDPVYLASDDYSLYKARSENLLHASNFGNWTIVRPATTYSRMRFQLTILEANTFVRRALEGKLVLLPEQAMDKPATLSYGRDVAEMIARLLFNPKALRDSFNVATAESNTWRAIAGYYEDLIGLKYRTVDKEDFLRMRSGNLHGEISNAVRWQLELARMFDRVTDNSKILAITGMRQQDLMPLYSGLKLLLAEIPDNHNWGRDITGEQMDAYMEGARLS